MTEDLPPKEPVFPWLDAIARLTQCAVLLVHPDGRTPEHAGSLGGSDVAGLWRELLPAVTPLRARAAAEGASARLELVLDGRRTTAAVRVLALGGEDDGRMLVLLGGTDAREGGDLPTVVRTLAHDLRGHLNSMVLNLDLLRISLEKEDEDDALRAQRGRYLAALEREVERLNAALTAAVEESS